MAHKTLIGGTAYEISGGKTLVDGTAYKIAKGKTLVDGTAYEIDIANLCEVTIHPYVMTSPSVTIDGTKYAGIFPDMVTLYFPVGTIIYCEAKKYSGTDETYLPACVKVNDIVVAQSYEEGSLTYEYTVEHDIEIYFSAPGGRFGDGEEIRIIEK